MTKAEYIEKYGEEAYQRKLNSARKYHSKNKEKIKEYYDNWYADNKELKSELHKQWRYENKEQYNNLRNNRYSNKRENGISHYCSINCKLIENYELAKLDNFNANKWHLHHRLENYYSSETLIRKGLYYNLNPEALIWLPADEHKSDSSLSTHHPELSKWHQRKLEHE